MTQKILKIILAAVAIILLLVLSYVVMNTAYFYKQVNFYFNPPVTNTQTPQPSNSDVKVEPNRLSIPSLGISAPIVEPKENNEASFQEALKTGVVHYPGTAKVGEAGNAYIFGHSSDFAFKGGDYKTVFALLPSIKNDAQVIVSNDQGKELTYKVTKQFVAASTDTQLLDQNTNGQKILTLQTSYPVGTALKRYIVIAQLVE